jgi:hypothetical protein
MKRVYKNELMRNIQDEQRFVCIDSSIAMLIQRLNRA